MLCLVGYAKQLGKGKGWAQAGLGKEKKGSRVSIGPPSSILKEF